MSKPGTLHYIRPPATSGDTRLHVHGPYGDTFPQGGRSIFWAAKPAATGSIPTEAQRAEQGSWGVRSPADSL